MMGIAAIQNAGMQVEFTSKGNRLEEIFCDFRIKAA